MLGKKGELVEAAHVGVLVAQKYRIEELLGVGGMGAVFAATHVALDERVAIKVLLPALLEDEATVRRFSREARAAVKIKGEHVVRVLDVGKLDTGAPYMVMELLIGADLGVLVADRGKLDVEETVDFVLQALRGIAEAHALGIVHRDLKPANLFVTKRRDGTSCIKVLDFGISKAMSHVDPSSLTQTAAIVGSPSFMPPEQWLSAKDIDVRADIWAIGAMMFQLITGHPPFKGDSVAQLCAAVLGTTPPSLLELRADAPIGIDQVILRCLAKDRGDRYSNVGELAHALQPFASPYAGISAVESIAATLESAHSVPPPPPSSSARSLPEPASSRPTLDPPRPPPSSSKSDASLGARASSESLEPSTQAATAAATAPPSPPAPLSDKQAILETSLSGVLAPKPKGHGSRIGIGMLTIAALGLAAAGIAALDRRADRTTTTTTIATITTSVAPPHTTAEPTTTTTTAPSPTANATNATVVASSVAESPTTKPSAGPSEDHHVLMVPAAIPTPAANPTNTNANANATAARTPSATTSVASPPLLPRPADRASASVTTSSSSTPPSSTFKRTDLGGRH